MGAILLMVLVFAGYLVAYHTYGKFLARRIFKLNGAAVVPSRALEDGTDYVPTRRGVIFGHHFTSIAGTGPIVGPAIAIIWGWVPAVIWVFVGCIFMGAVHDFGSLVISLRNQGKSISDIAARYINPRVQLILFGVIFLELLIVIAIFGVVIAALFKEYPQAVFPVWCEIPIALALGWAVYKRKWNVALMTLVAVVAMYVTVVAGHSLWKPMPEVWGIPPMGVWVIILLAYAFVASTLPVTTLLQPRDYINAWQLFVAMALLIVGVLVAGTAGGLEIVAPKFQAAPAGAPPFMPFLFVTIACGAISGFHSLVAGGTTSKQLSDERHSLSVGYGSMLMEGALALLVIIAVAAGIGMYYKADTLQIGPDGKPAVVMRTLEDGTQVKEKEVLEGRAAWQRLYPAWTGGQPINDKIRAFVEGSANMVGALGIPRHIALIIMGVFLASFAGTTLDTATRLQRYVVGELAARARMPLLANRWIATAIAVVTAFALAFSTGIKGTGAMKLWPMFGALNQSLAALALLLVTVYLARKGGLKFLITLLPCLFMLVVTLWAMVHNEINYATNVMDGQNAWLLLILNAIMLLLALWMVVEVIVLAVRKLREPRSAAGLRAEAGSTVDQGDTRAE